MNSGGSLNSHDGPPEPCGYGVEVVVGVVLDALGVVDKGGEDDDAEDDEEEEEHEFLERGAEGLDEDLEAGVVLGELEEAHDADDGEELEGVLAHAVRYQPVQALEHPVVMDDPK